MGGPPSTQTTINKTELPKWVDEAAQQNLDMANEIAAKPYEPYTGALTQGQTDLSKAANAAASANLTAWLPAMGTAADTAAAGTTYQPTSFLQGNVSDYMNPYIDNVIDRATTDANRAFQQNLNGISANAVSAGAFGGSRQGIAEGVAAAENAKNIGDMSAQLRAQGFDTASGLLNSDLDRSMQGEQLRQSAATNLASIGQAANDMTGKNATLAATLGEQERQVGNEQLQSDYAKWKDQQDADLRALNLRLAAVGATPYGSTQSQTSTASGGSNGGMQLMGGILGMLPFMFGLSDEREKTDIEELGKDPETGLPLISFRYKGDPKTYPKVVGFRAQDIEKKYPEEVEEIGGRKAVNLGFGGGALFNRGH